MLRSGSDLGLEITSVLFALRLKEPVIGPFASSYLILLEDMYSRLNERSFKHSTCILQFQFMFVENLKRHCLIFGHVKKSSPPKFQKKGMFDKVIDQTLMDALNNP